jgi:hypothetical protein
MTSRHVLKTSSGIVWPAFFNEATGEITGEIPEEALRGCKDPASEFAEYARWVDAIRRKNCPCCKRLGAQTPFDSGFQQEVRKRMATFFER